MLKRLATLLLALAALSAAALAEVYEGTTVALSTLAVTVDASGVIESLDVRTGQHVEEGTRLASLRSEKTFATQDGTVSLVYAEAGDDVNGAVLEIMPVERYTICCTVEKAYRSAGSTLVHGGETVYAKCTADGTHRAVGTVTRIDGDEYRVLTLGGELYVGETVYLYRDDSFSADQRVGIGTVITSDTQVYEAEGELTLLRVAEGDYVERGQLLYAIGGGDIAAPADGIVASLSCQPGSPVAENQIVAEIVPAEAVGVEIRVDESAAAAIRPGDAVLLTFAAWEDEDAVPGSVVEVSSIADSGLYAVRREPENQKGLYLGMRVDVRWK